MAQILCDTATKINPADAGYDSTTGWSERYGYGRVDAAEAVRQADNSGRPTPAHFVVVWEDDHDKNRWHDILGRGFTGDGRLRMHTKRVNSVTTGQQHRPAVAVAPDGDFVVVWEDDQDENGWYDIRARGFAANGQQRFPDLTVNSATTGQQHRPAVAST